MKQRNWIVTGYSSKQNGLLFAIRSDGAKEAMEEAARIMGMTLFEVKPSKNDEFESCFGMGRGNNKKELVRRALEDMRCEETPRWWWQLGVQQLRFGIPLVDATIW